MEAHSSVAGSPFADRTRRIFRPPTSRIGDCAAASSIRIRTKLQTVCFLSGALNCWSRRSFLWPSLCGLSSEIMAMERRLSALLAADVVGYSAPMKKDEAGP